MDDLKFLGRKVPRTTEELLPKGFRYSLGIVEPAELQFLTNKAFEFSESRPWTPPDNLLGLPVIRHEQGYLAAACCVLRPVFIHQFCVDPEWQKQGLGAALLARTAQLFDLPYVIVQVDETTTEAGHRFWAKQGFVEIGATRAP